MDWKRTFFLLAAVSLVVGHVGGAGAEDGRLAVGIDLTQYPAGGLYLPEVTFFLGKVAVDLGMNISTGEGVTQFAFRTAGSVRTSHLGPAELGFGGQFDLVTDGLAGSTLTGLGGFVEAVIGISQDVNVELRGYPLMISLAEDYTRVAIMGVGFSTSFFFR